jgi:hypothetical protein
MRGGKKLGNAEWRVLGVTMVAIFVTFNARDNGASFWTQVVIMVGVAAILTVLVELVVWAWHHRVGRRL